jgi:glutaredoxin
MQILRTTAALGAALLACALAPVQSNNDPATCPYCKGDPATMEKAGIVSHGGFEFGKEESTAKVDGVLPSADIRWIESKHFELGFALAPHKVKPEEKDRLRAELTKLQAVLPLVDPKAKVLDPWLRTHLFAQRAEEVWDRWLEIFQVKESDFPPKGYVWDMKAKYMGIGPYLGQNAKYEILILPSEAALQQYLQSQFGLLIKKTQRWNLPPKDTLSVTIGAGTENLREDEGLHGHLAFNLAINLLDGFKHYSYDTPIWIREGLAHFMEREITQRYNTFDSAEGGVAEMSRKVKWEPEVKKLLLAGKLPRLAEVLSMREYSDLTLARHYAVWSMTDFLIRTKPAEYARFNEALHGIMDDKGYADSSNLLEVHRERFREIFGWSYADFDRIWMEWVGVNYAAM